MFEKVFVHSHVWTILMFIGLTDISLLHPTEPTEKIEQPWLNAAIIEENKQKRNMNIAKGCEEILAYMSTFHEVFNETLGINE